MYDVWKVFMCAPTRKPNKPSYEVPKAWRNVMMGPAPRKGLTDIEMHRQARFLKVTTSEGYTTLSGRKGFPAIVYAIKKPVLGISMAATLKMNLIIVLMDIDKCYPRATKEMCAILLEWFGFPKDMRARFYAYQAGSIGLILEFKRIAVAPGSPIKDDFSSLMQWVKKYTKHYECMWTADTRLQLGSGNGSTDHAVTHFSNGKSWYRIHLASRRGDLVEFPALANRH